MELKYNWKPVKTYQEILFHQFEGIARISINRPRVHNAFTPLTVQEMIDAMNICRQQLKIHKNIRTK
jgi:naphthoate synthase